MAGAPCPQSGPAELVAKPISAPFRATVLPYPVPGTGYWVFRYRVQATVLYLVYPFRGTDVRILGIGCCWVIRP